jgi:xanthine dehydrogenase YagT iron-sulfur-binding subunit
MYPAPLASSTYTEVMEGDSLSGTDLPIVRLSINGEPRTTLLDALREPLGLTGSQKGCGHGQCVACTIHVNGARVFACLALAVAYQHDEITTIEGLANGE